MMGPERPEQQRDLPLPDEQPLELILARNLISIISIAALLVDSDGRILFFNEAAAEIVGAPFEEIGVLQQDQWSARYGPFGTDGQPLPPDELPVATAVRESRPSYGQLLRASRVGTARDRDRSAAVVGSGRLPRRHRCVLALAAGAGRIRRDARSGVGRARLDSDARLEDRGVRWEHPLRPGHRG